MAEDKLKHINKIIKSFKDIGCVCVCSNNSLRKLLYPDANTFEKMFNFKMGAVNDSGYMEGNSTKYLGRACLLIKYDNKTGVVTNTEMLETLDKLTSLKCVRSNCSQYTNGGVNYAFSGFNSTLAKMLEWRLNVGEAVDLDADQFVVIYPPPPRGWFSMLRRPNQRGGNTLHINTDRNISKRYTKRRRTRK